MDIPFYKNPDSTHCFQAVLRMILKYYWPNRDFAWHELEKITAKVEGLWTWPTAGMLWFHNNGFEIHNIEPFDYAKMVEKGDKYLIELFGETVAKEQIAHSNLSQELTYAQEIVHQGLCESRIPSLAELKQRLDEKYLLICNVNSRALNNRDGFVGHFVLLTGYDAIGFIMHDPGPPGVKNRKVAFEDFERAWSYPNENAQNYIAVKPKH